MLSAGNNLSAMVSTEELEAETVQLYSGITGWFLKHYLSYPSIGKRIAGIRKFAGEKLNFDTVAENMPSKNALVEHY
jgi:hypothetical protein